MIEVPNPGQGYQPQPQPQAAPTQPQPQAQTAYSSEPQMNTTAGDEVLAKVTVALDKEAMAIIQEASAIHGETIVNLGIKLFAKTNMYKEFMVKQEFKAIKQSTEDIIAMTDVAGAVESVATTTATPGSMTPNTVATVAAAPDPSGGFNAW